MFKNFLINLGIKPTVVKWTSDKRVRYVNWWSCDYQRDWFYLFVKENIENKRTLSFYSVFGRKKYLEKHPSNQNVFFSGENLDGNSKFVDYGRDYCLDDVGLSMGFSYINHERYLRFPLWILYVFSPIIDKDLIAKRITEINLTRNKNTYTCGLIASHDRWNMRSPILEKIQQGMHVYSAGKWRNNTNLLWEKYSNDKIAFLMQCKFNICAENTDTRGYVTEKIFDSFRAGSIPIYSGSLGDPEPGVINQDAVLIWLQNNDENHRHIYESVMELNTNSKAYNDFIRQEKLLPYTVDYVYETMKCLKDRLEIIATESSP